MSFPRGALAFPYPAKILNAPYGGYSQTVTKVDIVWTGDTIVVDSPLRSFGGDVILYGNSVQINAPIDTRVYVEQDVDFFEPKQPDYQASSGATRSRDRTDNATASNGFVWGVNSIPNYKNSYNDYYLHCYDCATGETRRPQLPSGLAAATSFGVGTPDKNERFDGEPAPDNLVVFPNVRSGNIYIFAHSLVINAAFTAPNVPADFSECTGATQTYMAAALNSSGIKGGSGGAGSASMCITHNPASGGFDCLSEMYTMRGGFTGPGGRGGDAGNIYIGLVNPDHADDVATLTKKLSTVTATQGGLPGPALKYQTPSARGSEMANGTRCSFKQSGTYAPAANGNDGQLDSQSLSSIEALDKVTRLLNGKDARVDYDLHNYLQVAVSDPDIHSMTFSSTLEQYLSNELVQSEIFFVDDVDRVFGLQQAEIGKYLPDVLKGVSRSSIDQIPFAGQQGALTRELQQYDVDSEQVAATFRRTGGMFHVNSKNTAVSRMSRGQLLVEVSRVAVVLTQINDTLRNIDSQLFSMLSATELRSLNKQLQDLKAELASLEGKLKQQQNASSGLADLISSVQKCGQAVGGLITAIGTEDPIQVASALKAGVDTRSPSSGFRPVSQDWITVGSSLSASIRTSWKANLRRGSASP